MTRDPPPARPARALPRVYPTVVHMLAEAAARDPGAEALACGERRLDYAGYLRSVAGFATELSALGARGERVATVLGNSIDACVAAFGTLAAGAQHVPLNPLLATRELDYILRDASPVALVVDEALEPALSPLAHAAGVRHVIAVGPRTRQLDRDHAATATLPGLPDPDRLALLQYTGGTTGSPKGVNLAHRAIAINVSQREALLPSRATCPRRCSRP